MFAALLLHSLVSALLSVDVWSKSRRLCLSCGLTSARGIRTDCTAAMVCKWCAGSLQMFAALLLHSLEYALLSVDVWSKAGGCV
jgi:hypothetical protein